MKVLIEMSAERYSELLERCDGSSSQFRTLIDGCLDRRASSDGFEEVAQILCDSREAQQLLEFASGVSAEAAQEIQLCLSCFREL
jgi:hypothetical protein